MPSRGSGAARPEAGSAAGAVAGSVAGSVAGTEAGSVAGAVAGSVAGSVAGAVAGSVTGSVAGREAEPGSAVLAGVSGGGVFGVELPEQPVKATTHMTESNIDIIFFIFFLHPFPVLKCFSQLAGLTQGRIPFDVANIRHTNTPYKTPFRLVFSTLRPASCAPFANSIAKVSELRPCGGWRR